MYDRLDELILARIRAGFKTFALILAAGVRGEAKRLEVLINSDSARDQVTMDRLVDRRLQALRKRGAITYTRAGGWVINN